MPCCTQVTMIPTENIFAKKGWAVGCLYQHDGGSAGKQDAHGEEDVERVRRHRGEDERADNSHLEEKTRQKSLSKLHLFTRTIKEKLLRHHMQESCTFSRLSFSTEIVIKENSTLVTFYSEIRRHAIFFKTDCESDFKGGGEIRHNVRFRPLAVISRSHSWKCRQINVLNPRLKKMPVYFESGSISVLQTGSRSLMRF